MKKGLKSKKTSKRSNIIESIIKRGQIYCINNKKNSGIQNFITGRGTFEIELAPHIGNLSFIVKNFEKNSKDAHQKLILKSNNLMTALYEKGIAKEDVKAENYDMGQRITYGKIFYEIEKQVNEQYKELAEKYNLDVDDLYCNHKFMEWFDKKTLIQYEIVCGS